MGDITEFAMAQLLRANAHIANHVHKLLIINHLHRNIQSDLTVE